MGESQYDAVDAVAVPALSAAGVQEKLARGDRPYITLKAAITLDGKIATRSGASRWITGEAGRVFAHRLRALHDGILVGINTVLADDSRLTVRLPDVQASPVRVILDSRCRVPLSARCLADGSARRIVIAGAQAPPARVEELRTGGVAVHQCEGVRPQPAQFLPILRAEGISTLLVEGGGQVHANMIAHREADELFLIIAGKVIGGETAPGWCASLGVDTLADTPRLALQPVQRAGEDLVVRGLFLEERDTPEQPAGTMTPND